LPDYIFENYSELSGQDVAQILMMQAFAQLIFSPVIGSRMKDIGRRNTLMAAMAFYILAMVMFAVATYFDSAQIFFWINFWGKFVQGIGAACTFTSTMAIICSRFHEKKKTYMAVAVVTQGVSLCFGPLICSSVYSVFSYR